MSARFPNPGEVFEGTYRIETILGSGGFARVYRAVEVALERPVALKILRPPTNTSQSDSQRDSYLETLMERFQREAMMLSRLRSPYTVNLHKYGKTDDGLLYMALEYIDGLSLAEIMREGHPLAPARAVKILKQVLASLQEAHTLGMLHRDLKPANIMVYDHLGERDKVKLLDFGIAKLLNEVPNGQADLTSDGTLIGTPRYMAPEQIQGHKIGPPADIYALGLVAYEMLTGERAVTGDSSIQIIGKQLAPQSFRVPLDVSIPSGLREVVNRMMAKQIEARYQTCEEVLAALSSPILLEEESDATELDISALVSALEDDAPIELIDDHDPAFVLPGESQESTLTPPRPRPVHLFAALLFVLAISGFTFAVVLSGIAEDEEPEVSSIATGTEERVTPTPVVEETLEVEVAQVTISARLGGEPLQGATVIISGVEKGITPMTIDADAVRDSQVVIRYQPNGSDVPLEEAQEVTTPRDVLVEFDPAIVVRPVLEPSDPPEAPKPATTKPSPQRPTKPPGQKPKKKPSIYETLVPE